MIKSIVQNTNCNCFDDLLFKIIALTMYFLRKITKCFPEMVLGMKQVCLQRGLN